MNNSNSTDLKSLFGDAAKEFAQKARLRCRINKLLDIMISDKERLKNAYAEIGRLYLDGELEKSRTRVEVLSGLINHLKDRIARGEAMYKDLEAQYEGRESADALKEELKQKLQKAKENTSSFTKTLSDKARDKKDELKGKLSLNKGKKTITPDSPEFLELLEEELKSDEETQDSAEKTMEKINALLESLDEDSETDSALESNETPEEVTKVVETIVEEATAELTKEEKESESSGEIAEDFTF